MGLGRQCVWQLSAILACLDATASSRPYQTSNLMVKTKIARVSIPLMSFKQSFHWRSGWNPFQKICFPQIANPLNQVLPSHEYFSLRCIHRNKWKNFSDHECSPDRLSRFSRDWLWQVLYSNPLWEVHPDWKNPILTWQDICLICREISVTKCNKSVWCAFIHVTIRHVLIHSPTIVCSIQH